MTLTADQVLRAIVRVAMEESSTKDTIIDLCVGLDKLNRKEDIKEEKACVV